MSIDIDRMQELYDQGLTLEQVGEKVGMTEGGIRYHFRKYGIPRRVVVGGKPERVRFLKMINPCIRKEELN